MEVRKLKQESPRKEGELVSETDLLIRRVEILLRKKKQRELALGKR